MLLSTKLIKEIEFTFKATDKWNFHPFVLPYRLWVTKDQDKLLNNFFPRKMFYNRHWVIHFLYVFSGLIFGIIKIRIEKNSFFYNFVTGFIAAVCGFAAITIYFHKRYCKRIAEFLNELIQFENTRVLKSKLENGILRNKQDRISDIVRLACKVITIGYVVESFLFALSVSLFPIPYYLISIS